MMCHRDVLDISLTRLLSWQSQLCELIKGNFAHSKVVEKARHRASVRAWDYTCSRQCIVNGGACCSCGLQCVWFFCKRKFLFGNSQKGSMISLTLQILTNAIAINIIAVKRKTEKIRVICVHIIIIIYVFTYIIIARVTQLSALVGS